MSFFRSRTGCFTCRHRKKKCDESKPTCRGCERNGLHCRWPVDISPTVTDSAHPGATRSSTTSACPDTHSLKVSKTFVTPSDSQSAQHETHANLQPRLDVISEIENRRIPGNGNDAVPATAPDDESNAQEPAGRHADLDCPVPSAITETDLSTQSILLQYPSTSILGSSALTVGPGFFHELPHHRLESLDLLGFYLSRTANSMGNGSTDINPFVATLVPLAFASPLVLQLILAQSAAHRHASQDDQSANEAAHRHYHQSLSQFREEVALYIAGKEDYLLVLAVGSLILSLTEVARGDTNGLTFDHLLGAKALLGKLLAKAHSHMIEGLGDFLIEYYTHMSSLSMIAMSPQYATSSLLDPDIIQLASRLVQQKYTGQLCGCWLEILILIPQIFELGTKMRAAADAPSPPSLADDIVQFGLLQAQLMSFSPGAPAHSHSFLAGIVFKQAALLYLWTILENPHQRRNGSLGALIQGAVSDALEALTQLPATSRVNTSLCWPIAVIGNCVSCPDNRQILRDRLETMYRHIGLGNMKATLGLLEHVWEQPLENTSPWTLSDCIQEHQVWISFA